MDKAILILMAFVLIIGGVFTYIYFTQQDEISNPDECTLTISAEFNNKKIETGFKVNNEDYNTSSQGYTLVKVPCGYLINLENVNLDNQFFYKQINNINISQDIQRFDFILEEQKNISVTINNGNPINLSVYSENYKNLYFCLKWSLSYIFVKANYSEISKPKGFESWDRCYFLTEHLNNENMEISVSYDELSFPKDKDFINITLFNPNLNSQKIVKLK